MTPIAEGLEFQLTPVDNRRLANLCGQFGEHLRQIEKFFRVEIHQRGHFFQVKGKARSSAVVLLQRLYDETAQEPLSPERVQSYFQESGIEVLMQEHEQEEQATENTAEALEKPSVERVTQLLLRQKMIKARGPNQGRYLTHLQNNDINFGIGPAGTGKTYLAVAAAVEALEQDRVRRLILARPAVEAGERLGFLPGDLAQKIDPYLRPLYDALYEMLGFDHVTKLIERNIIEVAPLAFMRGRTLNEAFVILDEAQNTTVEQMKMFLTRIGFGSKVIVTGDVTQTDLPERTLSGLQHAIKVLDNVEGISFTFFDKKDVVRHPLVQRVVAAYEKHEQN